MHRLLHKSYSPHRWLFSRYWNMASISAPKSFLLKTEYIWHLKLVINSHSSYFPKIVVFFDYLCLWWPELSLVFQVGCDQNREQDYPILPPHLAYGLTACYTWQCETPRHFLWFKPSPEEPCYREDRLDNHTGPVVLTHGYTSELPVKLLKNKDAWALCQTYWI